MPCYSQCYWSHTSLHIQCRMAVLGFLLSKGFFDFISFCENFVLQKNIKTTGILGDYLVFMNFFVKGIVLKIMFKANMGQSIQERTK